MSRQSAFQEAYWELVSPDLASQRVGAQRLHQLIYGCHAPTVVDAKKGVRHMCAVLLEVLSSDE
jgi:hypothetical protein